MTCKASEIYEQLKTLGFQLDQLSEQGRIVMTQDEYNEDHRESVGAVTAALEGIDQAISAIAWMETLPTLSGDYPPLKD